MLRLALDQAKGGHVIGTEIKVVSASMVAAAESNALYLNEQWCGQHHQGPLEKQHPTKEQKRC